MLFKFLRALVLLVFLLCITLWVPAQHEIDLTGNVNIYGQLQCDWCGAASGQMIMDGYPNPADRLFIAQANIWNTIQANNSTDPTDVAQDWATDPIGLRGAMLALNPPPGGTWSIHTNANRDTVMFDILYWMNRNEYPVATLINQGAHWVVIVGYETDVEPVMGSNPVLREITTYDPEPHNIGSQSTMQANIWFDGDWNGGVWWAGTWNNQYVAVIEPPVAKGQVRVKVVERIGREIISPEKAIEYAKMWIQKKKLYEKPAYAILRKENVRNLKPLLVREEIRFDMKDKKNVPYYYIIPFGFEHEKGVCGVGLTRVSVIVNAYTGNFEEITTFGKPVKYLPEKEAINIVTQALHLKKEALREIKISMMYRPSEITHIRTYPFWKVVVGERIMYVDQLGKLYTTIRRSVPGD